MQFISLKYIPDKSKMMLLEQLGLNVDEKGFITKSGKQVLDKYIEQPVRKDNMAIFPGSTIVLDDNPLSIASYIEEYGDI
jgi:hypothetical protein